MPRNLGRPPYIPVIPARRRAFYADFLFAFLRAEVPDVRVFRDSDTLQPGMVFSEKIEETVAACDILLAVIGKKWAGPKVGGKRRIDEEDDWVRMEIAAALRLKKWVIPCLVGGAKMPGKGSVAAGSCGTPRTARNGPLAKGPAAGCEGLARES